MLPRIAYRQFHDQTNTAAVALVLLAEFGLTTLDVGVRGLELELQGLLQRGRYEESRGLLLRNALRYLFETGLPSAILHDSERTAALQARFSAVDSEFKFELPSDLGARAESRRLLERDFSDGARVLLVEAKHAARSAPVHILLARREGDIFFVMNTATGQDHVYEPAYVAMHLASPVRAGAVAFAGRQYLYTGIAIRMTR